MQTISLTLSSDHHRCDELFAQAEDAAAAKDWDKSAAAFQQFHQGMVRHFAMEEEVMFPAFEARTGMTMGPTQMMRTEHRQMEQLFQAMADALQARDSENYLGQSETLLMLMQQHNLKEENILYPMAEQVLGDEQDQVVQRMNAVNG